MKEKSQTVLVDVDEIIEIHALMESLVSFFHQPMHYEKVEDVENFLKSGAYEEISRAYYKTIWNWLPPERRRDIEEM